MTKPAIPSMDDAWQRATPAPPHPGKSPTVRTCAGCGEYWPCTVELNRKAYRGDIAAAHYPAPITPASGK